MRACQNGYEGCARAMLQAGAAVNHVDAKEWSALMRAWRLALWQHERESPTIRFLKAKRPFRSICIWPLKRQNPPKNLTKIKDHQFLLKILMWSL